MHSAFLLGHNYTVRVPHETLSLTVLRFMFYCILIRTVTDHCTSVMSDDGRGSETMKIKYIYALNGPPGGGIDADTCSCTAHTHRLARRSQSGAARAAPAGCSRSAVQLQRAKQRASGRSHSQQDTVTDHCQCHVIEVQDAGSSRRSGELPLPNIPRLLASPRPHSKCCLPVNRSVMRLIYAMKLYSKYNRC